MAPTGLYAHNYHWALKRIRTGSKQPACLLTSAATTKTITMTKKQWIRRKRKNNGTGCL
jgi:hypothetical protein